MRIATPVTECAGAPPLPTEALRQLAQHASRLAALRTREPTPRVTHALGLVELAAASHPADLDRAVRLLREAHERSPGEQAVRADLAAALLVRYAAQSHVPDLLEATELTAVDAGGSTRTTCRNLVSGLAWLGARTEAARAHESCASVCRDRGCRVPVLVDDGPVRNAAPRTIALAARWTDFAWDHASSVMLPAWARARRLGDSTTERQRRADLDRIDANLRRRANDSSLARAIAEAVVHAPASESGRRHLRAIEQYGEARVAGRAVDGRLIDALLDSVRAATRPDEELHRWAEHAAANRALSWGRPREALGRYRALHAARREVTAVLGTRLRFNMAMAEFAMGDQLAALDTIERHAADCLAIARSECAFAALGMAAGIASRVGDPERSERNVQRALTASVGPLSTWHWTITSALRQAAEQYGWLTVADRLQLEAASVAAAVGRPDLQVQDLVLHARARVANGDTVALRADLELLSPLIHEQLGPEDQRVHLADLANLEGDYLLLAGRRGAGVLLDSAIRLMASDTNLSRQVRPAVSRARADLAEGDTARAVRRSDSLLRVLAVRGARASYFEQQRLVESARAVSHVIAPVLRVRGEPMALLSALSGAPFSGTSRPRAPLDPGRLDLAFRRLGDSVLVWSHRDEDWTIRAVHLPPRRLRHEASIPDSATLGELHELLLAPELERAGVSVTQLRLDVRDDLVNVPWAALYDRRRRRHLVERFAIWQTEDIARAPDGGSLFRTPRARKAGVLLVDAAPTEGRRALPGAREEVQRLGALWGDRANTVDAALGADALLARLASYEVVHWAGHAVLDARRPEDSYLLWPGVRDARIDGAQLAALPLPNTALVVLAACDTRASGNAAGGLQSLAHALRSAGARHVLGAAWPIDDAATAVLMARFHAALRDGQPVAVALRIAQLESLRSPDPALRSPRVWAAFQLLGS